MSSRHGIWNYRPGSVIRAASSSVSFSLFLHSGFQLEIILCLTKAKLIPSSFWLIIDANREKEERMKILIRKHKNGEWQPVSSAKYRAETELQKLLAETPALISLDEIKPGASPPLVAVRECGLPGSGNTDILAFNGDGDIVIVECKLAANAEIKRKVIGQVLEYGAYLWGMSYEKLNELIYRRTNEDLAEMIRKAVEEPDWDEEELRLTIEETLQSGAFILIIAVDEINEELNRTIKFINGCGNPNFAFTALEMSRFQSGETEILVPHVFGISKTRTPPSTSERKKWSEELFFQDVNQQLSPDITSLIRELYNWSRGKADRVSWGTGKEKGSFTFHYLQNGSTYSMFSIYTNGALTLNFGHLTSVLSRQAIREFREEISTIPQFEFLSSDSRSFPTIRVKDALMNQPETLRRFKLAIEDFARTIRETDLTD
jgi:RecB family endonuclease NucS